MELFTKQGVSVPITTMMVWEAYKHVKQGGQAAGTDGMTWEYLHTHRNKLLYGLWVRLASGSYFPKTIKAVSISKKDGSKRVLGLPTLLDRIAQQVVRVHLEKCLEPHFHQNSYGYRPGKSMHDAVNKAKFNSQQYPYVITLDIKSYFDTIPHDKLMKALQFYCKEKWVSLYVSRWLKSAVINEDGSKTQPQSGTPQGGVIALRTHPQTLSFAGRCQLKEVNFKYIIKSIIFMTNGKIAELGVSQTHQPGVYYAAEGQTPAADSKSVNAEVWSIANPGLSLYPISQRDQRKNGDTGKICGVYCKAATNTDQADKEIIRIQRAIDQQSGSYCAGRIFSKEGSCQERRNKLRYHLPMIVCGSKSSRRSTISLFQPISQLFSLNNLLMN